MVWFSRLVRIVSRWPIWSPFPLTRFHVRREATVVSKDLAMEESVSPLLTLYTLRA